MITYGIGCPLYNGWNRCSLILGIKMWIWNWNDSTIEKPRMWAFQWCQQFNSKLSFWRPKWEKPYSSRWQYQPLVHKIATWGGECHWFPSCSLSTVISSFWPVTWKLFFFFFLPDRSCSFSSPSSLTLKGKNSSIFFRDLTQDRLASRPINSFNLNCKLGQAL